jgi:hypothetical protein
MRTFLAILLIAIPAQLLGQTTGTENIDALMKKLGSDSFQLRRAAFEALKKNPEAAPALREALRSPDADTRRQAAEILDYFDKGPVRELNLAVKEGRIDRFVELLSVWPKGKHDDEVWQAVKDLRKMLVDLHRDKGGCKINPLEDFGGAYRPETLLLKTMTEKTAVKESKNYFIRVTEIDVDIGRLKPEERLDAYNRRPIGFAIVSARSVRTVGNEKGRNLIFAGGSTEILAGEILDSVLLAAEISQSNAI